MTTEPVLPVATKLLDESAGPITAVSDFMKIVPEQIARFTPAGRPYTILGTDGMGRSDTRDVLRRLFEIDAGHVVVGVFTGLARSGEIEPTVVADAIHATHRLRCDAPDQSLVGVAFAEGDVLRVQRFGQRVLFDSTSYHSLSDRESVLLGQPHDLWDSS